ncbi:MAG: hypothetical protein A07HR60_01253, partial [uncultured archaeon A07HR60]
MRHAAAGNPLTLETATSGSHLLTHHRGPTSSGWHVTPQNSPRVGATERRVGLMAQPALLLTRLDARECHALALCESGQQRADTQEY